MSSRDEKYNIWNNPLEQSRQCKNKQTNKLGNSKIDQLKNISAKEQKEKKRKTIKKRRKYI